MVTFRGGRVFFEVINYPEMQLVALRGLLHFAFQQGSSIIYNNRLQKIA
jgi:hypothetical protein